MIFPIILSQRIEPVSLRKAIEEFSHRCKSRPVLGTVYNEGKEIRHSDDVDLADVSHLIKSVRLLENDRMDTLMTDIQILSTPVGNIAKTLLDANLAEFCINFIGSFEGNRDVKKIPSVHSIAQIMLVPKNVLSTRKV